MKPIKLQFKGINSFSEKTEIDFERLTNSGIFGIFGDTGSGKSTILDCINFALYGKVERSKEKLDIINYRCDSAEVKFEFDVLSEGKRKKYSVERSLKRKSGLHKAMLYEDGNCIADNASTVTKKITDILGVDAEDFRKCIALPQGEFSQFVKSQPSERIALIERLFSLYKYGDRLKERIKERENQAELNYMTVSAKLGLYGDVSEENLKGLEARICEVKAKTEELLKESVVAEKKYDELKSLGNKADELDEARKRLKELSSRESEMEELKAGLKAAPICKAVAEADAEITSKTLKIENLKDEIKDILSFIETEKNNIENYKIQKENEKYEERIEQCIKLSAQYASCERIIEESAELNKRLIAKRGEYKVKCEKLKEAKSKLAAAESEVEAARKKLEESKAPDIDNLINVYFKGAVLKDEYVNALDYFVDFSARVESHKDGSKLYEAVSAELKKQIEIYKDRVYQVKDFNLNDAENRLKCIQSANKEREALTAEINERTVSHKTAQTAVERCEAEIETIFRDGDEIKRQFDDIKAELAKIFGGAENYDEIKRANAEDLDGLKKKRTQLFEKIEKANEKLFELNAKLAAKNAEEEKLEEDIKALKNNIAELLRDSGYDNVEACKRVAEEFEKFNDAEKALEEYRTACASQTAIISKLEKVKGINDFSEKDLEDSEIKKNSIAAKLAEEREKSAVYSSDLKNLKVKLKEKEGLQAELKSAEKDRNLIAGLKELIKGNKFMEYIANEYLYEISALASSMLLNLTDGRYFLTYTDNFYAGDNFNCGNLRGVNTLSGGETFLVSLSLALALSQTICSSLKSIEFFFLDEGFGTLDGNLIDTVMSALEKLKSSNFTIGIISHVEELKHRIDNKITVFKATESHGSYVQVSC